jgi:hypothetical protein
LLMLVHLHSELLVRSGAELVSLLVGLCSTEDGLLLGGQP